MKLPTNVLALTRTLLFSAVFVFQSAEAQVLSLQEALHLAKQNNVQLRKQSASERIARLEELVQKANRLPSLDLALSATYLSEINEIDLSRTIGVPGRRVQLGGNDRSELILSVSQPIFTGFRISSQIELAENSTLSEEARFEIIANEIYHQVYRLFYRAQSLYKQRKILDASLNRLNVQRQNVRNLFEAAQVMAFDTLQVTNQTVALRIEKEENARDLRLVHLQMLRLLDLEQTRPILEITLDAPMTAQPQLDSLRETASRYRPEFDSIELAKQSTTLQQKLARSAYFPTLFGQANYHYAKPGLDPVANDWMDYFSVGVNLQWNLWRWRGDRRKVEEFEVLRNRVELEERDLQQKVRIEVEQSLENLQFSLSQWQLANTLKAQEEERYRIVSVQHKNGIASTNDLITAEADLTRAEQQTQQALVRYYLNLADLKKAVGTIGRDID